jgi:hypothetical protein
MRPWTEFGLRDCVMRALRSTLPEPYRAFKPVYATTALDAGRRILH